MRNTKNVWKTAALATAGVALGSGFDSWREAAQEE